MGRRSNSSWVQRGRAGLWWGSPLVTAEGEPLHLSERPSFLETGDELTDRLLALTAHDIAGVPERLVGAKAHVRTAEDDRHRGGAEKVGETVGGRRGGGRRGDPDEVGAEKVVQVDRCERLAVGADIVAHLGEHAGHERETKSRQEEAVVDVVASRARLDETDPKPHRSRLPQPPLRRCADSTNSRKHASGPRRELRHGLPAHLVRGRAAPSLREKG